MKMETRTLPAGLLGKYYAARHSYGHYRSCGVTAALRFSKDTRESSPDFLEQSLKFALYHTIKRYHSLCYGLKERTKDAEAHFIQLQTIKWEDVTEFHTSNFAGRREDIALEKHLGHAHERLFTDPEQKPAWKLFILRHDGSARVDISYVNHHAIGDGTSGAAFHKTLLNFLYQAMSKTNLQVNWPYHVPIDLPGLSYIEEAYRFPLEPIEPANTAKSPPFDPWTAAPPSLETFTSRVRIITIPASYVPNILTRCRHLKGGATLTSLLHSLLVINLSRTITTAQGFTAVTPYSMRRFSGVSDDEIVNHISNITTQWRDPLISSSRFILEGSKEEEELIERIAKQYRSEINSELASVPNKGPGALIEISKIHDFDQFCEDGMKKKRGYTYELSNVGAVAFPERPEDSERVELEKLVFTQCGMVAGPAIGCSVISVTGKPLVVSLHWQQGIVEDKLITDLAEYVERRLLEFGKGNHA